MSDGLAGLPTPAHRERIRQRRNYLEDQFTRILPRGGPLVLEIGCGHGHFLAAYSASHPEETCIGVDIEIARIRRAEKKQERSGLAHLHFLRADARDFLATMPPGACISAAYILFPDPWPKRRHHKNRLLEPSFLHALAQRAGQGTRLYFRTDFEPYFDEAAGVIAAHPRWHRLPDQPWPFEEPTVFQRKATAHRSLIAERA
ncbi:MAG TPA: tRNA (guanosine(46)-N7)-methyltransferase TrmB [Opitutaceae bacterium]|nr:tRNA (guanosine(46)-N7)-methyltransferase TrmB [Opitutaceae bacterium]